ncbi:MAG: hypothetical protein V4670_07260 [Bacteroidota bacterium]
MKSIFSYSLLVVFLFSACKKDVTINEVDIQKAKKEKELVFNAINKAWNFPERTLTPEAQIIATNWNEWRLFINELNQKPQSTISAFKIKTKNLVQKAEVLQSTIPSKLNKPQVKTRLTALITKLKALNMFLNVDRIPEKRVVEMVTDLNLEVNAVNYQIEKIVRRSHIQLEEGEAELIQRVGGKKEETETKPEIPSPTQGEVKSFEEIK